MSFPTLGPREADRVREGISHDLVGDELRKHVSYLDGPDLDESSVDAAAERDEADWRSHELADPSRRRFDLEAFMAERVHTTVQPLDIAIRQEPGFWRYLALFPYRWYLREREPEMHPQDYGGVVEDHRADGTPTSGPASLTYQLLFRTYLWGKIAFDSTRESQYELATKVNETGGAVTDVWHSHLIRTQLGQLGPAPHAFLEVICEPPIATSRDAGRAVEKRLTRMKHTVLYDVYESADMRALADEQKRATLGADVDR